MGSVEAGYEGSWLPHPEEQLFLDQLFSFMDRHGSPIHKVPNLGFKKSQSQLFLTFIQSSFQSSYPSFSSCDSYLTIYI